MDAVAVDPQEKPFSSAPFRCASRSISLDSSMRSESDSVWDTATVTAVAAAAATADEEEEVGGAGARSKASSSRLRRPSPMWKTELPFSPVGVAEAVAAAAAEGE